MEARAHLRMGHVALVLHDSGAHELSSLVYYVDFSKPVRINSLNLGHWLLFGGQVSKLIQQTFGVHPDLLVVIQRPMGLHMAHSFQWRVAHLKGVGLGQNWKLSTVGLLPFGLATALDLVWFFYFIEHCIGVVIRALLEPRLCELIRLSLLQVEIRLADVGLLVSIHGVRFVVQIGLDVDHVCPVITQRGLACDLKVAEVADRLILVLWAR